jgi:ubiquinone/menaquinone biosynthesis C-methylase UbiE
VDPQRFLRFKADLSSAAFVSAYDELPLWSAMFGLLLLDEVPLAPGWTALDVGCGTGFPLIELAERLGPDSRVHGIDLWMAALTRAAAKIEAREMTNVTLHEGSAAAMPFGTGTFDLIVSNLGLNNFDDRQAVVRECRRVARDGAVLALTTNLRGHMREFYEAFDEVLHASGDLEGHGRLRDHVHHRATVPEVRTLLESGGFEVSRVVERTAQMRFANGTALLNHSFIKLGFLDGWKQVVPGREVEMFLRLERSLNDRAVRQGAITLTIPMAYVEGRAAHGLAALQSA